MLERRLPFSESFLGRIAFNLRRFSPTPRFDRQPLLKSVRIAEERQVPVGTFDDRDTAHLHHLMLRLYQLVVEVLR